MSQEQENQGVTTPDVQDPLKNLKGEMNRKLDKQAERIDALMKQNSELLEAIRAASTSASTPAGTHRATEDEIESLFYSDPKKYTAKIQAAAVEEAERRIAAQIQQREQTASVMNALANEYPELADTDSELVKVANEILSSIPQNERNNTAYRYAVREAAGRLDLKPRSKRDPEDSSFISPTHQPTRRRARSDSQLVDEAKDFAAAIGLDLSSAAAREAYLSKVKGR